MARLALPERPTPEQAEVMAEAVAGKRGRVPGPMIGWLVNPELARRAQHLGALLRYETVLAPVHSEMAILICARHWTSHYEWTAHKKIALQAGLDPKVIAAIAARQTPDFDEPMGRTVHAVASRLMSEGKLDSVTYELGLKGLGERGMVDLVALLGYYSLVALTLNAFELGLPEAVAADFA